MSTAAKLSDCRFQVTVPAKNASLKRVRQLVLDATSVTPLSAEDIHDLNLAVTEAVTNAIRHSKSKRLTAALVVKDDGITATVTDQGCGFRFSPRRCKFPGIDSSGGRGLPLMNNLVDSCKISSRAGAGTEVTLVKKFQKSERSAS